MASFKWGMFKLLERLSDLRGRGPSGRLAPEHAPDGKRALWVFVSTLGELNAIEPFLRKLVGRLCHLELVLITDHAHYQASYRGLYPNARVWVTY